MDYLKIVLDGYCNENERKHLVDYFKREALKAQKEFYNFQEFFDGCNDAVDNLQKYYHYHLNKEKMGFYNVNESARNRKTTIQEGFFDAIGFPEYNTKSYDEQCDKLIEFNNDYIKGLDLNNYLQPLVSLNMGYYGHLSYNDTQLMTDALNQAKIHFELKELKEKIDNFKPADTPPPNPFEGLLKELDDNKLDKLFTFLTTKHKAKDNIFGNALTDTNIESIKYVFGSDKKPINFIGIKYTATNTQWLREIFTGLQKEVKYYTDTKTGKETRTLSHEIVKQIPLYFIDKDNKPLNLSKNKQVGSIESDKIKEFFTDLITN